MRVRAVPVFRDAGNLSDQKIKEIIVVKAVVGEFLEFRGGVEGVEGSVKWIFKYLLVVVDVAVVGIS